MSTFHFAGFPSREEEYYNEQEYQYDYEDDKAEYSEENRREEISFRPSIVSDPVMLDVDNGMTIRLPCLVDKLPGRRGSLNSFKLKSRYCFVLLHFSFRYCFTLIFRNAIKRSKTHSRISKSDTFTLNFDTHFKSNFEKGYLKTCNFAAGVQIIWSKEDSHSTQIAIGTVVVAPEYMERATVTENGQGSTLHIGIAKSEDAGRYKCSVAVRGEQPALKHEVRIRGESLR